MVLKSMAEFVSDSFNKIKKTDIEIINEYISICKYAAFLQEPLTLGMFVPCNADGEALIDPLDLDCDGITYYSKLNEYECAKHNILFKDFELVFDDKVKSYAHVFHVDEIDSIEELALKYGNEIEFTSRAIYNLFR